MNTGSKVAVVAGRHRRALEGYAGTVDTVVRESGKVCATFVDGHGEDAKRVSLLFGFGELSELGLKK